MSSPDPRPLLEVFARVSRRRQCPICGKPDWCLVDRSDPPNAVVCKRVPSPRQWGDAGWHHRLGAVASEFCTRRRTADVPAAACLDLSAQASAYADAVRPEALESLALHLGVSAASLRRLGIGWTGRAWSFPMAAAGRVCGIRLRHRDGSKWSVKGGKEGLFVPSGLHAAAGGAALFLPEGPTDTAALLDLGFEAAGRPSCSGGARHAVRLVMQQRWTAVVVVADADGPGQAGARSLAGTLAVRCPDVRVITPPAPFKDIRSWAQGGAAKSDIDAAVAAAHRVKVEIAVAKGGSWTSKQASV